MANPYPLRGVAQPQAFPMAESENGFEELENDAKKWEEGIPLKEAGRRISELPPPPTEAEELEQLRHYIKRKEG